MNNCQFYGRLTRDPESKYTKSGKAITNFSIAVNGHNDNVTFVDLDAWEKTAETIAEHFRKGDPILIESARFKVDTWENEAGEKRSKGGFVVNRFGFTSGKKVRAEDDQNDTVGTEVAEEEKEEVPF